MCGIAGIININNQPVSEQLIRMMMQKMKHRGPDDEGVFVEKNVGLGFVRLSILDLSPAGHQPMFSKDKRFVIVFNGEIFNYLELREELEKKGYAFLTNTDTEVVINSYIEWGEKCQHKFNGMWAFAIFDTHTGHLFISRDRYGIKPFYYIQNENFFAFASEIPPLLALLPQKPEANMQAVFDFIVFNRTDQTEDTFYNGIKKLQHGYSFLISTFYDKHKDDSLIFSEYENDAISGIAVPPPQKWYDLKKEIARNKSKSISAEEFKELFSDSIRLRLRSDVPVGVCLSGGLDSSAIVSILLHDYHKNDLRTFSAVYNKGQRGDETAFIKLFDSKLKNMFYTTPNKDSLYADMDKFIKLHAEPIPTTGPYAQYKVMELAKKHVVVTLDGQGADEILAGYHYFFGFFFKDLFLRFKWPRLIKEIFCYLKIHQSIFGIKSFIFFLLPSFIRTKIRVGEKGYLNKEFIKNNSSKNSISGNLYAANSLNDALINHIEFKLEHLLKWEDRNSMAFSLEARVPFLDHRIVEAALGFDGKSVIKNGMTKSILRESMKGILPEKIRLRTDKVGFATPEDEWFREEKFQKLIKGILTSERFRDRKIINADKAIEMYKKHASGKINISKEIWKWIHLELWFRNYID